MEKYRKRGENIVPKTVVWVCPLEIRLPPEGMVGWLCASECSHMQRLSWINPGPSLGPGLTHGNLFI